MGRPWAGILTVANVQTPDRSPGPGEEAPTPRIFEAFTWRQGALCMRAVFCDTYGHMQAAPVARMDQIWADGDRIRSRGIFSDVADGRNAETLVAEQIMPFVSVDPSDYAYREEWVDPATQTIVPSETLDSLWAQAMEAIDNEQPDEYARIMAYLDSLYIRLRFTRYEIGGATLCAIHAIAEARIELVTDATPAAPPGAPAVQASAAPSDRELADLAALGHILDRSPASMVGPDVPEPRHRSAAASLASRFGHRQLARIPAATLAAGAVATRPAEWYARQNLTVPTPFSIGDDGRISGHLTVNERPDGTPNCHRGIQGNCVTAGMFSNDDFSDFHTGGAALDDGTRLRVGIITYADLHAEPGGLSVAEIRRRIEDTGTQIGNVRLWRDEFGVQASGAVYPDVPPEQVARALAGFPSGDWRMVAGSYRLYGVHIVNTPAFPVVEGYDGEARTLVASMAQPGPALSMIAPLPQAGAHGSACCGAKPGEACSCSKGLDASDLADLAALDQAQRFRRRVGAGR